MLLATERRPLQIDAHAAARTVARAWFGVRIRDLVTLLSAAVVGACGLLIATGDVDPLTVQLDRSSTALAVATGAERDAVRVLSELHSELQEAVAGRNAASAGLRAVEQDVAKLLADPSSDIPPGADTPSLSRPEGRRLLRLRLTASRHSRDAHEYSQTARQLQAEVEAQRGRLAAARHQRLVAERRFRAAVAHVEEHSLASLVAAQIRNLVHRPRPPEQTPLDWPVSGGAVSSTWGARAWPVFNGEPFHTGLDIAAWPGTPVMAAGGGVVTQAENHPEFGKLVTIRHPAFESGSRPAMELFTRYAHLGGIDVAVGEEVGRGQQIGVVGSTGNATTGPHLHFEVRLEDHSVDPLRWLAPSP
jgi:murein DD-endopeptidase MepM/ murein hydrolase activator NlpD